MYLHWLVFVTLLHRSVPYRKVPQPHASSCPAMQKRQSEKMSIRWVTLWKKGMFDRDGEREGGDRAQLSQLDYYIISWWRSHVCLWKIHVRCFTCVIRSIWLWSLCMDNKLQGIETYVDIVTARCCNPEIIMTTWHDDGHAHLKILHQKSSLSSQLLGIFFLVMFFIFNFFQCFYSRFFDS